MTHSRRNPWRGLILPVVATSLILTISGGCITSWFSPYPPLPRDSVPQVVAVMNFENRSGFSGQWEIGSGMADLLVSELVRSRNFVVVERSQIDRITDEIQRQKNKLFRSEGRVDEGRLKNAHYLIRGVINDFSQYGRSSIGVAVRNVLSLGRGGYRARVALTLTIIDVETGEILDSVQCVAKAAAHSAYVTATYKDVTFGGDAFARTPLGSATGKAIYQGVCALLEHVPRVPWRPMIASADGNRLILNGGKNRRIREGELFEVRGEGRPITDPATGDVLSVVPGATLGRIRVTSVDDDVSVATPVEGTGFTRGQRLVPVAEDAAP